MLKAVASAKESRRPVGGGCYIGEAELTRGG
jgi:hypothetical protein